MSYTVTLTVDPSWVTDFNSNGTFLVMAKAMSPVGKPPVYNVVAQTYGMDGSVMPTMVITWVDNYQLAGTEQVFSAGVQIAGESEVLPVTFGETYHLESWAKASVVPDTNAPKAGFRFKNDIACSCLALLEVDGNYNPAYISVGELEPGFDDLTPTPSICLYWSTTDVTSSMISSDQSNPCIINFDGNTSVSVIYNKDGQWVIPSSKSG